MSGETSIRNAKASDVVVATDFTVEASESLPAEWQKSNRIAALIRLHNQGWLINSTNVASIGKSEERRVGKECASNCRSRCSTCPYKIHKRYANSINITEKNT